MTTYNEYRLPNLNINMKRISVLSGPQQATYINNGLNVLDEHDHTEGKGTRITPEGFIITDSFDMRGFHITNSGGVTFTDRSSDSPNQGWFVKFGNFYIRDGLGNIIQLTEGNDFIGLDDDIIGGDYDESDAIVSYSSATGTYSFRSSVDYWADLRFGTLNLHDSTEAPTFKFTLQSPSTLSTTYTFKLPSVRTSNQAFLVTHPSGSSSFLPEDSNSTNNQIVQVLADGGLEVGSIKLKNFPLGVPYKGLSYGATGSLTVNGTSASILPAGLESERPSSPPIGLLRGNTEKGVLECYLEGTWKKAISIDIAGLSFSDFIDVDIVNPQELEYFVSTLTGWENTTLPHINWSDINNLPDDVTDLSLHSIGEFNDISTIGAVEGQVLRYEGGVFSPAEDGGEGAIWGNISGDILNQTDLLNLLNTYLVKPDETCLVKDINGNGDQGKLELLADISIDTNSLADDQVLQYDGTNFTNATKAEGTISPVTMKGDIYIGVASGVSVLPLSTNEGYLLTHKNNVLQWVTTENMTGGGGKFKAVVLEGPSVSKSLTLSTSTTYQLCVDVSMQGAGAFTLTGFHLTPIIYNTLEQGAGISKPSSETVTLVTDINFYGKVVVTFLPLVEGD